MAFRTLDQVDLTGKRALVRVDFNVPMHEGEITDDTRLRAARPTVDKLRAGGAKVILIAHFDRPVLFAWGPEDQVFPIAHAQRYAQALASAQLIPIPDAYSFTPEDQPAALADAIRRCFPPAPTTALR